MNIHDLTINKLINGGYGLGRLDDGRAAMVRLALPGETVDVRIERQTKSLVEGVAVRVHAPHPRRIEPPCPYYGDCGGCDLQHGDYPCQLELKKAIISDLLQRHPEPAVRRATAILAEPLPSPLAFGYRQRIRLQIDAHGRTGFRRFHRHEIVAVAGCQIARDDINQTLATLRPHPAYASLLQQTTELEIMADPDGGGTVCVFILKRRPRPRDFNQATALCRESEIMNRIFFAGRDFPLTPAAGRDPQIGRSLSVTYPAEPGRPALTLGWEAGGFCQINLAQNRRLIATVVDLAAPGPEESVLDLFCGMGNFSIPLATGCRRLLGIEGQGSAIRSARANARCAGIDNAEFRQAPIHDACTQLTAQGQPFDCVIIDPPRQGAPGLARQLAALTGRRLVYISCDPATLCRDLGDLIAAGFTVRRLQPVDMFPQTHHIETVVLLEKN
ncbi:class I SAM-dependent RNA methyltransferase [Desulfoprunum benzoelyticum]|uniref:23S rRNA (Uracil1939-C5)-methyltransferase n=1 Tax=Desulfoprunum benzoelyticum TaxID=1506996 RepID=A0A840URT4_9BACT|nr:class I SAM-dependent RNA methyltransferase [Desulfoprunum benzoelyticum]MBB5348492.1 23S rRNA (uracil1939-C5)-methyltransferase [Desulfoprunum benzoelyticum]MBM9530173.1 class I SAM-dependent RNA methyltransferase [Desulfoprunum benzoelyticum]